MAHRPLVSIVIPCYNAAKYLDAALRSCLHQDHEPLEIIVVDDGSTDASASIARSFAPRVQVISGGHRGHCAARNIGYFVSSGEFVQFFDADDVLARDKISASVRAFDEDPELDVVFTQLFAPKDFRFDADLEIPSLAAAPALGPVGNPYPYDKAIAVPHLNSSQPLFRRRALERYGIWDEGLSVYDDLELNFRLFVSGAKYRSLDRIGIVYRHYPSAGRVSYREHAAHPDALPALAKIVDLAIRTGSAEGALRNFLLSVMWYAAQECISSLRVAQARAYLDLAMRLDRFYAPVGALRAAVGVFGPMPALALLAVPQFLVKTSRCARYRITIDQAFFDNIAPDRDTRRRRRKR